MKVSSIYFFVLLLPFLQVMCAPLADLHNYIPTEFKSWFFCGLILIILSLIVYAFARKVNWYKLKTENLESLVQSNAREIASKNEHLEKLNHELNALREEILQIKASVKNADAKPNFYKDRSPDFSIPLKTIAKPIDHLAGNTKPLSQILIIDDHEDTRLYIEFCLRDKFRILQAANGREGLALLSAQRPALVVCDVMMPELNGFKFCEAVRSNQETSHIPVILLTAKTEMESQVEGLQMGADDYITKPFTKEVLVSRIENLIHNRERLRSIFKTKLDFQPREIFVRSVHENFLSHALEIIERNIDNSNFGAEELVRELGISRSVVHRKFKDLTDLATGEFIKATRLKRACQLLKDKKHRVSEICYMVGFSDPDYFRKSFKNLYGVSPRHYHETNVSETHHV
jgi:DNA-binding response OmpR family regulator